MAIQRDSRGALLPRTSSVEGPEKPIIHYNMGSNDSWYTGSDIFSDKKDIAFGNEGKTFKLQDSLGRKHFEKGALSLRFESGRMIKERKYRLDKHSPRYRRFSEVNMYHITAPELKCLRSPKCRYSCMLRRQCLPPDQSSRDEARYNLAL